MDVAKNWEDYEILDMANGEKLERWGDIILIRPDPQIIWKEKLKPEKWQNAHARYKRSKTGGGSWEYKKKMPENWQVKYKNLTFNIRKNKKRKKRNKSFKPVCIYRRSNCCMFKRWS